MIDLIILQHGQANLTERLLRSVRDTQTDCRIILVDNGSPDPELDRVEALLHEVDTLILLDENLGYAAGYNEGLRASSSEFVCIQNNDTILYPGVLDRLAAHAAKPGVAAVGPLCNANESEQSIGRQPDALFAAGTPRPWETLADRFDGVAVEMVLLAGFCTMIPRAALDTVGLFSTDYGLSGYGSDDDWCHRAHGTHNLKLLLAYDAYVHHDQRATNRALFGDAGMEEQGQAALRLLADRFGT